MKTYKGEKIEKNETEMTAALNELETKWLAALQKKDKRAMDGEMVIEEVSFLANYGLFTRQMINDHYVMLCCAQCNNFRRRFVMPYIIGTRDNFEILTHNAEVFNKNGLKAERT